LFDRPPLIKLAEAAWYPLLSPPGRTKLKMLIEPNGFDAAVLAVVFEYDG